MNLSLEQLKETEEVLRTRPPEPSGMALAVGCLLLAVTNTKVMDRSDWLCVAAAAVNFGLYALRAYQTRKWNKRRDALSAQLRS